MSIQTTYTARERTHTIEIFTRTALWVRGVFVALALALTSSQVAAQAVGSPATNEPVAIDDDLNQLPISYKQADALSRQCFYSFGQ